MNTLSSSLQFQSVESAYSSVMLLIKEVYAVLRDQPRSLICFRPSSFLCHLVAQLSHVVVIFSVSDFHNGHCLRANINLLKTYNMEICTLFRGLMGINCTTSLLPAGYQEVFSIH